MIFYFSGTGNSRHAALELQEHYNLDMINMADAVMQKQYSYPAAEGERVFFVFPVYFGGLPGIVDQFISNLDLTVQRSEVIEERPVQKDAPAEASVKKRRFGRKNKDPEEKQEPAVSGPEIIGIATFGGTPSGCGRQLQKALKKKGLPLRAFYSVKAPENCIFYSNPPIREAALVQLKHMEDRMKDVMDSIDFHHRMPDQLTVSSGMESGFMHHFYKGSCKTAKFCSTDACIGCGLCEKVCPVKAIRMENGRPSWVKSSCEHCTACINRCPKDAIEYGRMTKGRNRYAHPDFGKKYRVEKQK
jgi:NAD-dependent dihydropyrimidine dehydrogenase PreA subunit